MSAIIGPDPFIDLPICGQIWPEETNPAKRRRELRSVKKPTKLMDYADRIARAIGADPNDVLLDAFRDTRFDEGVAARIAGRDDGADMEEC